MTESIIKQYYDGLREGKILAHVCKKCGTYAFPPTTCCEKCSSDDYEPVELSGKGKLNYLSHGFSPPPNPRFTEAAPYAYGHICLNEGVYVQGIVTNVAVDPAVLKQYYEKGPVDVVADIQTYADDVPVLAFKVV